MERQKHGGSQSFQSFMMGLHFGWREREREREILILPSLLDVGIPLPKQEDGGTAGKVVERERESVIGG